MPLSTLESLIHCLLYLTSVFHMTAEKLLSSLFQKRETSLKIMRFYIKPLRHQESTFLEGLCKRGEQTDNYFLGCSFPTIFINEN